MTIISQDRIISAFRALRAVHPTRSQDELVDNVASSTGLDSEIVRQVIESGLAETEGGTHD
jgi:hypothetical protein